jgi:hypothetical protein
MLMNDDEFPEVIGDHDEVEWIPHRDPIAEPHEQEISCVETLVSDTSGPYLITTVTRTLTAHRFNKAYDQNAKCAEPGCDHPYYRHFDTYENMAIVGCKYCICFWFKPV